MRRWATIGSVLLLAILAACRSQELPSSVATSANTPTPTADSGTPTAPLSTATPTNTPTLTSTPTVPPTSTSTDGPVSAAGSPLLQGEVTTETFSQVEPGATRAEVEALLGAPDERQEMLLPEGPFWGPQEALSAILEPGAPFEEWVYHRDEYDYYVWFAAPADEPGEDWQVIQTASYPAGAVF
jgi:hypothetical protein